jgi:hypothetical protein
VAHFLRLPNTTTGFKNDDFFSSKLNEKNHTNRSFEKDSQINDQHQQQIKSHHNKFEFDLERDHALPTSAPNADILKSNNNPTYPNPNRHHNHNHRHQNATPSPQGELNVSTLNLFFLSFSS